MVIIPENEPKGSTSNQIDLLSQYKEMKLQMNKSSQEIYTQIKGTTINKIIIIYALDQEDNAFNLAV